MLSGYTKKYLELLKEEVELYSWFKKNKPTSYDIEDVLSIGISSFSSYSVKYVNYISLADAIRSHDEYRVRLYLANNSYNFSYSSRIIDWAKDTDVEKASLYISKYFNSIFIQEKFISNLSYLRGSSHDDFRSLPMKEIFLPVSNVEGKSISKSSLYDFASFCNFNSAYSQISRWDSVSDKETYLKFMLIPKGYGDVSIQVTPNSYTQVGNQSLENSRSDIDLSNDVIYFDGNDPIKTKDDSKLFKDNIPELEKYALNIESFSKYSILELPIDSLLSRLQTSINIERIVNADSITVSERSISYKLIFDISENKSVIVPSVDIYQSLLYLKAMGTKNISLYYDNSEKRIVVRGEDLTQEIKRLVHKEGSRFPTEEIDKIQIPTFAIIYEQPVDKLTGFMATEYLEFFSESMTFRDKYTLLKGKNNAPLTLSEEFSNEYPEVAETYEQQKDVSFSVSTRKEKYDYVYSLINNYLASYTELVVAPNGKTKRVAIKTEDWDAENYVLKPNEAYWNYNSHISIEELLSFFLSKGNKESYRLLSMKVIGVDYYLFEQSITSSLIESKDVFVSKIDIDESNISLEISYEDRNTFVSGNVYEKESSVVDVKYANALRTFFGEELGTEISDKAITEITSAKDDRFIPSLAPKARTEAEADMLRLNIDIFCPIFFSGKNIYDIDNYSDNADTKWITDTLITGKYENKLDLKWSNDQSSYYNFGHFELFKKWLKSNSGQILGEFNADEIIDAYIFPVPQDEFVYSYLFPKFKDQNGDIVGFTVKEQAKGFLGTLQEANDSTRVTLNLLGYINDTNLVTAEEALAIKDMFLVEYKERCWEAKKEGRRLFNLFLSKGIDNVGRQQVELLWNKTYNNYAKPDLSKVPIFPSHNYYFGKKSDKRVFNLMEAQLDGVRHTISRGNSGLFLHEVGFGKTTSSITAISSMFNTGDSNRALFLVPPSVYDKFQDEIIGNKEAYGLLPDTNIVLIDNLGEPILKKIKDFTEDELSVMKNFKVFYKEFKKIFKGLKRKRLTLDNDPIYTQDSSWSFAYDLVKKELEKNVSNYKDFDVIKKKIDHLQVVFNSVNDEWKEIYSDLNKEVLEADKIIDAVYSGIKEIKEAEAKKKKALKAIEKGSEDYAKRVQQKITDYLELVTLSLIDELGIYKKNVLEDKTILIGKHTAANKLRPSYDSVMKALCFKEGISNPSVEISDYDEVEWANITGLTRSKVKIAGKVINKHPISLDKLMVDSIVVDEIHNFNNIVQKAGTKGWFYKSKVPLKIARTYSNKKGSAATRGQEFFYSLQNFSGRANKARYDRRYDSTSKKADPSGAKLSVAALCFDIQYKTEDLTNVLLLSATPFTDSPFQVISVLGMANYKLLSQCGVKNSWDFFNNFVDETYKFRLTHDGGYGLFVDVDNYYNDKALSNLITNISNVKITDEQIEKNRPFKGIIPQNKIAQNTSNDVSETTSMGDYFDELSAVNSKIQLSEPQEKFRDIIAKYLRDDDDNRTLKEIFPINQKRAALNNEAINEEVEEIVIEKLAEAYEDKDSADFPLNYLEQIYDKGKYAQHPRLKEAIDEIKVKIFKEVVEKTSEDDLENSKADTNQMSSTKKLIGKAIACQTAQQALVISPYLVNLGDDSYTSPFLPDLEPDPATVFVEQSPKLLYTVKAIQASIDYQKEQLKNGEIDKIGGQVVYFDLHNFSYGGKKYNAFELLAEYIARNVDGVSSDAYGSDEYKEIGIIDGKIKDNDTVKGEAVVKRGKISIKNGLNNGEIKVLIGSQAIKEGIDLQGNAHTMYICEAEFSPEVAMQLEGRIWRQKNPYDIVRIVYVLAMNTIDSFIYDKINSKVNTIKKMLEGGVYEMNTTQFIMDTKEVLIQLETDPDKLTLIQFSDEKVRLRNKIGTYEKRVELLYKVKEGYEIVEGNIAQMIPYLQSMYDSFTEWEEIDYKAKLKKALKQERTMLALQEKDAAKFKGSMKEWQDQNKGKYDIENSEIEALFKSELESENFRFKTPQLENKLSVDTPFDTLQQVASAILKRIDTISSVAHIYSQQDEEGKEEIISNIKAGSIYFKAFLDVDSTRDENAQFGINSRSIATLGQRINRTFFDMVEDIQILEAYQGYVKGADKTLDDMDEIIAYWEKDLIEDKSKLADEAAFKAQIRADWVVALANRAETTDLSIDGMIETFKESNKLLKIRNRK